MTFKVYVAKRGVMCAENGEKKVYFNETKRILEKMNERKIQ